MASFSATDIPVTGSISIGSLVATVCMLVVGKVIYDYFTHPLANFPGPFSARWSNALHCWNFLGGRQPYKLLELHEKYGPVVRTAPNELSFSNAASWRDIYGFRPGHKTFIKSPFYDGGSFADQAHSIVSERDPTIHGQMRKYLSHAFSDRSLKEQEHLVSVMVDLFVSQLEKFGAQGLDMVMWFNLLTFDIIGSLAFGEPFGGLESAKFHPWIGLVTGALRQGALADAFMRFPRVAKVFMWLMPSAIDNLIRDTRTHEAHTMKLVEQRIAKTTERPDFLTRILDNRGEDNISDIQIAAHASDFVTAGSETTATCLSCATYYLLKNPSVLEKLQQEIRGAFKSYDEITAKSTSTLKYLHAVSLEAMRIYAPLPFALPRVVPSGGDTIDGHFVPADVIVSTSPVAAGLSCTNFDSPFEFKPERWLGENRQDDLEASQPFSLGPRGCLGRNLAWMELDTVLAKLYFKFDMKLLNPNLDWQRDSQMHTLWKKPELMVSLVPRAP